MALRGFVADLQTERERCRSKMLRSAPGIIQNKNDATGAKAALVAALLLLFADGVVQLRPPSRRRLQRWPPLKSLQRERRPGN